MHNRDRCITGHGSAFALTLCETNSHCGLQGRTLASAGVPPTAPDLMSGSPRPSATPLTEIMYTPTVFPANVNGGPPDPTPFSAQRPKRRGDPRLAAASSVPPQPASSLSGDTPAASQAADTIEQLANMDPTDSANVLASIIAEAPQVGYVWHCDLAAGCE
jgi:hypothetical protein